MQLHLKSVLTRRCFEAVLTVAALYLGIHINLGAAAERTRTDLVYVGTHNSEIRALRLDESTGKLTSIGTAAEVPRPTWAVAHPTLPILYTVDESSKEGSVIAFAVDRDTGALTRMSDVATGGSGTTYLGLDVPSMTLLTANYAGGSTSSIAINRDGSLGALVSAIKATGSGPHRRQASAHAHSVAVDPSGRYALVADMGADRVFVYSFDRATHALAPEDEKAPRAFVVPPGTGPRHFAFGADGRFVYLISELTAEIMTLRWDAQKGQLTLVQTLATSTPEFKGTTSGAEVAVSGDGRFVYVGNRSENALLVYRADRFSGELSLVQRVPSGGEIPWSFSIDPSGRWMLVANQRSNKVSVFRVDPATGELSDTGQSADAPTPVSITFMR